MYYVLSLVVFSMCKTYEMKKKKMVPGDAVIIELRNISIKYELDNFRKHLPKSWNINILHNNNLRKECDSCKYIQLDLKQNNQPGKIWYNNFLKQSTLWKMFDKEFILLFEKDSILCEKPSYPLNYFFQFDYIGAPWHPRKGAGRFWCNSLDCCVGNSGLSLWNRTLMYELTTQHVFNVNGRLIDFWVSSELQRLHYKIPNTDYASFFSMETSNIIANRTPFGMHFPDKPKKKKC